jgi:folate-binding protein YgfZ
MGEAEVRALQGYIFADLSSWWKFLVTGSDARTWLDDLVTNRVDDIGVLRSRRTLLLSRTGHVRADVHVLGTREGLLLVQDPVQPAPIRDLLEPYVLSSDVEIVDRTADYGLLAHPTASGGHVVMLPAWTPSVAGYGHGLDLLFPADQLEQRRRGHGHWLEADEADLEVWRIRRGAPRFGVDFGEDTLPGEARLDELVDRTKGCFLGQEVVAKVANLGHPPRLFVSFTSGIGLVPGDPVLSDGREAGRVTSVAPEGDGFAVIARIRWDAAGGRSLETAAGDVLNPR